MASHPMQLAVVGGRFVLTAHGPVASLLEARGEEGPPPAPPTWLGKPAFFLAIAGVVLWNVYGKRRDGYGYLVWCNMGVVLHWTMCRRPNAERLLERLAAARKDSPALASFVGARRVDKNLVDFD